MARWLFKTEPSNYSWDMMIKDRNIRWTDIGNNWALKFLRQCEPGDSAFFYHTGNDRCIMGIVEVTSMPYPHHEAGCDCGVDKEEKFAVVDVKIKKKINSPVTLKEIKADSFFEDFHLPKYGRLSVMPVSKEIWEKLIEMGEGTTSV